MENTTLYELYSCDEWRSTDSINVNSRIVVTDSLEYLADVIYDCVMEDPDVEKEYKKLNRFEMLEAVQEQQIDFLHFVEVDLNERMD